MGAKQIGERCGREMGYANLEAAVIDYANDRVKVVLLELECGDFHPDVGAVVFVSHSFQHYSH